jgi:hypothetical protein
MTDAPRFAVRLCEASGTSASMTSTPVRKQGAANTPSESTVETKWLAAGGVAVARCSATAYR